MYIIAKNYQWLKSTKFSSKLCYTTALKYGMHIGTRLTTQDVYLYLYRLVFGACPCCLPGKTISPSNKESLSPTALMPGSIVHIVLIHFPEKRLSEIQYPMLICDEFSTYLHSFAMNQKVIQT